MDRSDCGRPGRQFRVGRRFARAATLLLLVVIAVPLSARWNAPDRGLGAGDLVPAQRPAPASHGGEPTTLVVPPSRPRPDGGERGSRTELRALASSAEPAAATSVASDDEPRYEVEITLLQEPGGAPAPRASAEVHFEPSAPATGDAGADGADEVWPRVCVADGAGNVRLSLPRGELRLVAWSGNCTSVWIEQTIEGDARVTVPLAAGLRVAGWVRDAVTGAPVAGAEVSFWTHSERDRVRTSARGSFDHPRFPPDGRMHQVRAEAPGYGATVVYLQVRPDGSWCAPSPVRPDADVNGWNLPALIDITLVPELRVAARIVDPSGAPVPQAEVAVEGYYRALPDVATRDEATGRSDGEGRIALSGLRSDLGHTFLARAPGCAAVSVELPASDATEVDLGDVLLRPETVLEGVVLDPQGLPVPGIRLQLRTLEDPNARLADEEAGTDTGLDTGLRWKSAHRFTTTSSEGTFVFAGLAAGEFELRVRRGTEFLVSERIELQDGERANGLELQLPSDSLTLAGEVRGSHGPLAGATVELSRNGALATVHTDDAGRFRIAGLDDAAPYVVRVSYREDAAGAPLIAEREVSAWASPVIVLAD